MIENVNRLLPESSVTISYRMYLQGLQTWYQLDMNNYWEEMKKATVQRLGYEPNKAGYEYIDSL